MKALKKLAVFCVGAALTVGSAFGFAACDNGTDPQGYDDPNICEVYSLYVASAEESGNEPMTYEEWLASIKGKDGAPGKDGKNGKDGSSFLHGTGTPTQDVGKEGDLYLDTTTWHVYEKTAQGWNDLGSIQGPVGPQGPAGPAGGSGSAEGDEWLDGAVTTWSNVTINANDTYDLDVTDVPEGHYWLVAKTETVAAANVLTESYTIESDVIPYDMYSSLTNSFKGFAYISSTATSITLTNKSSANITGDFKLVEYTPVAITIGQEVEIPVPFNKSPTKGNLASYTFDNSLLGQSVKFSFSYFIENGVPSSRYVKSDEGVGSISPAWKAENDQVDGVWSGTRTIPADALRIAFTVTKSEAGCNAVIKIELAEA